MEKNDNRFYALFAAAAAIVSNYFILKKLYGYAIDNHYLLVWINSLCWILIGILFYKGKFSNKNTRNVIFTVSFIIIIFMSSVFVDRIIGFLFVNAKPKEGIVFEPNTSEVYSTTEFVFEAKINSIGLRDREVSIKKSSKMRILCFGDSFTYGWGVNLDDSWPKVLERYLNGNGLDAEVVNCGFPGAYPGDYKKYMEKAVPLLKPDIVLVGVQQLDDLAQLYEWHFHIAAKEPNVLWVTWHTLEHASAISAKEFAQRFLERSFKNYLYIIGQKKKKESININRIWKAQIVRLIASFDIWETLRYQTFEGTVKQMFETGNLNPGLLALYMKFPDRNIVFNDPKRPATEFAIEKMKTDFAEMANTCSKNETKLIFINIPNSSFTGHIWHRGTALDDIQDNYLYKNNKIDSIYRDIAGKQGIPYFEMTEVFKSLQDKDKYFFLYDGHPNKAGYRVMGESIGDFLLKRIIVN